MKIQLIIAFQTKNTPENTFILFNFRVHVCFGEEKKDENTANAALIFLFYQHFSATELKDKKSYIDNNV